MDEQDNSMKVGDLVKKKYDGVVALITKMETVPDFYQYGTGEAVTAWVCLLGQPVPLKAIKLEVISESR